MVENCSQTLTTESSVVLASFNGVSGISTIVGNSVILLALYKTPSLQTVSNYFVGSLAGADLFVGLFANSLYVALSGFVSLQEIQELKNAETFVWLLTTTVTTFNLCFVAVDRYVAIIRPLRYPSGNNHKAIYWSDYFHVDLRYFILNQWFLYSIQRLAETVDNWFFCDFSPSFGSTFILLFSYLQDCEGAKFSVETPAHISSLSSSGRRVEKQKGSRDVCNNNRLFCCFFPANASHKLCCNCLRRPLSPNNA